ncbi:hypothetical protein DFJ74DRAFT_696931 [Hyaloraphidium curvatum]|nr:hypothetical protein DFJ74DRAFT_696931 [Hyaloraphidium curvatum]
MILRPRVPPTARLPTTLSTLWDASGNAGGTVELSNLASRGTIAVVTMAQSWDPPGRELLRLLKWLADSVPLEESGPVPSPTSSTRTRKDALTNTVIRLPLELQSFLHSLVALDTCFVVVVPAWNPSELAHLRSVLPRNAYVVPDPMPDIPLAKLLGLQTQGGLGTWPAILVAEEDGQVASVVIGRGSGWYGDGELLQTLAARRISECDAARKAWKEGERAVRKGLDRYRALFPLKYDHPGTDPLPVEILLQVLTHLIPDDLLHVVESPKASEEPNYPSSSPLVDASAESWRRDLHSCALASRSFLTCVLTLVARHALPALSKLKEVLPQNIDGSLARPLDGALDARTVFLGPETGGVRDYVPIEVPYARDVRLPKVGVRDIERKRLIVERWRTALMSWHKAVSLAPL